MDLPNPDHVLRLAQELNLKVHQVAATAQLLAEGATVPFIARYRIALSMRSKPELGARPALGGGGTLSSRTGPASPCGGCTPPPARPVPPSLNGDWFTAALNKKK